MIEEKIKEKPSYYSVLPASVRYDKRLKANEKLLYSEITVLCNKTGCCYANNEYFAELYDVHKNTISIWINNLKELGYIYTKIMYQDDNKTIDKRLIFLSEIVLREIAQNYCENHEGGINDFIDRYQQKHLDPINENIEDNNTSINNKYTPYIPLKKNDDTYLKSFEKFWREYPKKQNKKKVIDWFKKNKPNDELMQIILEKIRLLKKTEQWQKNNNQFVPMPSTWLNNKRWEDEIILDNNIEQTDNEKISNGYEVL